MGNYLYHINDKGPAICRAGKRACPLGGEHFKTKMAASSFYEKTMEDISITSINKNTPIDSNKIITPTPEKPQQYKKIEEFDVNNHYGVLPPRSIQVEAMNGVVKALDEDDSTQLIAACGTGKTYMQRQILNKFMSNEDSNGIGVILTSSIKLARDTADDLRPGEGKTIDETFGKYGRDYEIIEVHSGVNFSRAVVDGEVIERPSVLHNGVISVDRIREQLQAAKNAGKKIIIVSTYDSVSRVQKAQAELDGEEFEADLMVHDEAHNILGQQKPTTIAKSEDNELTSYVGFHNSIPGAIQARKRLYSTATPVIRESQLDKTEVESLDEAIEIAKKMQGGDQYARITYYSDNEKMIGKMGGFISQNDAIEGKFLAKPIYSIREESMKGRIKDFNDPVVNPDGTIIERVDSEYSNPLTPKTYGALKSTLNALTEDYENDVNPPQNVLAYVGSINQAEGFKESFKKMALELSGGMTTDEALANVNSTDADVKRRARLRLIHDNAVVMAAHSRTDSESVKEREAAFKMFKNNAINSHEWSPNKKILANVDIFSEGVSIPEIDTVVVTDDDKLNERAMTQSIGRAIRTVPNNTHKKFGHVIIPEVKDEDGVSFNGASVNLAAYTATRVERAVTPNKLLGRNISKDTKTIIKVHKNGEVKEKAAVDFAQSSVRDITDIAVANEIYNTHTSLVATDKANEYKEMNHGEQMNVIKSKVQEKINKELNKSNQSPASRANQEYYESILNRMNEKTAHELRNISRNGRVLSGALGSGDVSSINPELTNLLIRGKVLNTNDEVAVVPIEEKRKLLKKFEKEFSFAVQTALTDRSKMYPTHITARELLGADGANKFSGRDKGILLQNIINNKPLTGEAQKIIDHYNEGLKNDEFVDAMYELATKGTDDNLPALKNFKSVKEIRREYEEQEKERMSKQLDGASGGEQSYSVDDESIKKTGELTTNTIKRLYSIKAGDWEYI